MPLIFAVMTVKQNPIISNGEIFRIKRLWGAETRPRQGGGRATSGEDRYAGELVLSVWVH